MWNDNNGVDSGAVMCLDGTVMMMMMEEWWMDRDDVVVALVTEEETWYDADTFNEIRS
jgi:hypothetical protein